MTTYEGIKRAGPPQAIQKLREDLYMVQITLSETPSADWKRLFYETQQSPPPDFPPRVGGHQRNICALPLRGSPAWRPRPPGSIAGSIAPIRKKRPWAGGWTKSAASAAKSTQREQQELAAINARWEKL